MNQENQTTVIRPALVPRGRSAGSERTPLYTLVFNGLPEHRKETNEGELLLDVQKIANEIKVSKQKVWFWLKENRLPGQRVAALINLEGSTLTFEALGPFIKTR